MVAYTLCKYVRFKKEFTFDTHTYNYELYEV